MIKSITIVTAQGVDVISVGRDEITSIMEETKQVATDKMITVYRAYQGGFKAREISATCPLEITFEKQ